MKWKEPDYTKEIETFQDQTVFEDVYISGNLYHNTPQFYPPSVTTEERDALSVTEGAMIYNTTNKKIEFYTGTSWTTPSGGNQLIQSTQRVETTKKTLGAVTDWTTTTYNHAITPKAAGSKIKIWLSSSMYQDVDDATGGVSIFRSVAGGTFNNLSTAPYGFNPWYCVELVGADDFQHPVKIQYIDSPTYTLGQTITYEAYYISDKGNNQWNGVRSGSQVWILEELSA